jgi:SAM-dependent methyltransferase
MNKVKVAIRTDLINRIIKARGYTRYLEIGTQKGVNLVGVQCAYKLGVDIDPRAVADIHMGSDEYFATHPEKFDIVFIDGLHHADQVQRDICNALNILNPGGIILCHDMLPKNEAGQLVPRQSKTWYGDCWKAFVRLRARPDLHMYTIPRLHRYRRNRAGQPDPTAGGGRSIDLCQFRSPA